MITEMILFTGQLGCDSTPDNVAMCDLVLDGWVLATPEFPTVWEDTTLWTSVDDAELEVDEYPTVVLVDSATNLSLSRLVGAQITPENVAAMLLTAQQLVLNESGEYEGPGGLILGEGEEFKLGLWGMGLFENLGQFLGNLLIIAGLAYVWYRESKN